MASLDRAALESAPRRVLSIGRNRTKGDVYALRQAEGEVVVKDFAPRPWLGRHTLGRWFAGREARAYRALAGVPGIPELLARPDAFSLVTEKIEGDSLRDQTRGNVSPEVFRALAETLGEVHRRGVAVADLHHRNVILASDRPYLIDLGMAVVRPPGFHPLRRLLFLVFRRLDRIALLRMKARYCGQLSAEERRFLETRSSVHRLGRGLKAVLNATRLGRHSRKPS